MKFGPRRSWCTQTAAERVARGETFDSIGRSLGVSGEAIHYGLKRLGLTADMLRGFGRGPCAEAAAGLGDPDPAPQARPALRDTSADDAALIATGGRYVALAAWADARGVSLRTAQARWHRLRLPLARQEVE